MGIKILEKSVCSLCSNSKGNFDGGFCCENHCDSLFNEKIVDDKFVKSCSKKIKEELEKINSI